MNDDAIGPLISPDYYGEVGDPRELANCLSGTVGVVEHGLFSPELISEVLITGDAGVTRYLGDKPVA